jgi:hypothetical protein
MSAIVPNVESSSSTLKPVGWSCGTGGCSRTSTSNRAASSPREVWDSFSSWVRNNPGKFGWIIVSFLALVAIIVVSVASAKHKQAAAAKRKEENEQQPITN